MEHLRVQELLVGPYTNDSFNSTGIKDYFQVISDSNAKNLVYYSLTKNGLDVDTQRTTSSSEIIKWANENNKKVYYTKDNIGAEFRRKKFNLAGNGVQYNPNTGRIQYIEFIEQ